MSFPSDLQEREQYILDMVRAGKYEIDWVPIKSMDDEDEITIWVSADALKVEGVRVNVMAETQQMIADMMGAKLLTAKIADLIWLQADIIIPPFPQSITSSTEAMISHSGKIDNAIAALGGAAPGNLISTVGKHWLIDNKLAQKTVGTAMNYGWHFFGQSYQGINGEVVASLEKDPKTGMYYRLIQGRGTCHDMHHVDYSQTASFVLRSCQVNGESAWLDEVLVDEKYAKLLNVEGKMTVQRQPGVPEPEEQVYVLPEQIITVPPPPTSRRFRNS